MAESEKDSVGELQDYYWRHYKESIGKFSYFMVGLVFTILGLSVQVTTEYTWLFKISWFVLLGSGFSGILSIKWDYDSSNIFSEFLRERLITGKPQADIKRQLSQLKCLDLRQNWCRGFLLWFFIIGILGIAIDKMFCT